MYYTTLFLVREYMKARDATTGDDNLLTRLIRSSTKQIVQECDRRFDVYKATHSYDYPAPPAIRVGVYNPIDWVATMNQMAGYSETKLRVHEDLLEPITVTNGDGTTIAPTAYVLKPANTYPKFALQLKTGSDVSWEYASDGGREQIIDLEGYWGYHPEYSTCWVDTLDTVQTDMDTVVTTIDVVLAGGIAADLQAMRFQAGNMLKIESTDEDDEFVFVVAVDHLNNQLTVVRSYNGTSAVAHTSGDKLYVFRPWANAELACTRLAVWRYRQKDSDSFNREILLGTGELIIPTSMPVDVRRLLPVRQEKNL